MNKIKITPAKYNAYYALNSSSTYEVSEPRVLVVPDCEIKAKKTVEWVDENEEISLQERELTFNLFDGMGLISPAFAAIWASDMGCDYLPSSFVCRAPYIKGNLMVFDFQKFAREVAHTTSVSDIYGNAVDIERIDVILTQSQFKLWNAYESWDEYQSELAKTGLKWGVSRIPPNCDKDTIRVNYQFLQVLNLSDEDIAKVCEPTIEWLRGIAGGETNKALLYLMGKVVEEQDVEKAWSRIQDSFVKCLLLDNRLINDEYIKTRLLASLKKRISESYMGKLLVSGNYQEIFADGYALCEHVFGMEVRGLLKDGEHYSAYWNDRDVKVVVAMRSPLTWRSEVNLLHLQNNAKVNEWFQYVKSGIIYNVWGIDNMLQAGSDFDGDGVFTTDNEVFIKCRYGGAPVAYEPKKAAKEYLNRDELMRVSYLGFNTKIGYITNLSTTMYEMLTMFEQGSKEYNEILKRLKLCCYHQSQTIDSAKGIATTPLPKEWTRYTTVSEKMTETEREYYEMCNKIIVESRPYFMRYLYGGLNTKYKNVVADSNRYCEIVYGMSYEEAEKKLTNDADFAELRDYRDKKCGLLVNTNGGMNRICRAMEKALGGIKKIETDQPKCDVANILLTEGYEPSVYRLGKMEALYNEYKAFRRNKELKNSEFIDYAQYYKRLRDKALETISSDIGELGNLAVTLCYCGKKKRTKDFAWDVFGCGILQNVMAKHDWVEIPIRCDYGKIEYLGHKYDKKILVLDESMAGEDLPELDILEYVAENEDIFGEDYGDSEC